MNKILSRLMFIICFVCSSSLLFAQNSTEDVMRSNGKIYVVVAVALTILIGLFLYVFLVDRKISKIEKDN